MLSPPMRESQRLSEQLTRYAGILAIKVDGEFRKISGLEMPLDCIKHLVNDGKQGIQTPIYYVQSRYIHKEYKYGRDCRNNYEY